MAQVCDNASDPGSYAGRFNSGVARGERASPRAMVVLAGWCRICRRWRVPRMYRGWRAQVGEVQASFWRDLLGL